jgi:hypothetical protein
MSSVVYLISYFAAGARYVEAIKFVKRCQKRHGAKLGPKDTLSPPNSLWIAGC